MTAADFPPGGPEARSTLSRFLRILMIVSLALNMFFLGAGAVLLGRMMTDGHQYRRFVLTRGDFPGPGRMLRALPEESRARIEREIRPERAAIRAAIAASQRARREAFAALTAEPFSADVLRQRLSAAEAADVEVVHAVHRMLAAMSAQFTPEDRARLAAAFKAHHPGAGQDEDYQDGPPPDAPRPPP